MSLNIVLFEPEIPANTGNIGRTCVATGTRLHLIEPLGFRLNEKSIKRAGMDYLDFANVSVVDSFQEILDANKDACFYYASTKSQKRYSDVTYPDGCFIVFGKESYGLSENILKHNYDKCIRIPMAEEARSLNLSNCVAVIVYEALRQLDYDGLATEDFIKEEDYL